MEGQALCYGGRVTVHHIFPVFYGPDVASDARNGLETTVKQIVGAEKYRPKSGERLRLLFDLRRQFHQPGLEVRARAQRGKILVRFQHLERHSIGEIAVANGLL